MCVRYSPAECAEYGWATKFGTLLYILFYIVLTDVSLITAKVEQYISQPK